MLLALGFGAGAIGALDPNALLGENLISTVVSIAVGIILYPLLAPDQVGACAASETGAS